MVTNEYYNSKEFEKKYHYEGKLGAFCSPQETSFYLWAPTAERVVLKLYRNGDGEETPRTIELSFEERGVWSCHIPENLDGFYYRYHVTVEGITRSTADPYARACGVNGHRSMILNLARTNPEGWEKDQAPASQKETIIYELHVKDFTWDPSSGVSEQKRGKYAGLIESGTTLNQDGIHATGIDYLKSLGITHVQLMPVYDYGSVDEAGDDDQFNWGYDPVNYNIPEGSYSSNPYHGEVRIKELKQVIKTLHENGLRVIMDVVYNHTYQLDSFFNRTVPGYYYRFDENGIPSNGSGCGNDTASERSMCAKYILDSILYWIEEYHFDGFRFDLMGLIPVDLMNQIRKVVDEKYGAEKILLFGEPWSAQKTNVRPGTILALKENLYQLDTGVGAFCDATRDVIKGNLMQENARGFVNGGEYNLELHRKCLLGWSGIRAEYSVNAPSQTIGYMSCHDDWTLWDRLNNTIEIDCGCEEKLLQANRLAIAILFGCQGHLFLLAGEEAGRSKNGIKNSYNSSITINRMDWNRIWRMESLVQYYRGLFALRKQLPCLCDKSKNAAKWMKNFRMEQENCVVAEFRNPAGESPWEELLLIYNMDQEEHPISVKKGAWQILVEGEDSFLWKKNSFVERQIIIPPMSATILGK